MRQKYHTYQFVDVSKDLEDGVHIAVHGDFIGIIHGSYSQLYGGRNIESYSIYETGFGKVINQRSWFQEWQITPLPLQSITLAMEMIEEYNFE